MTDYVLTSVSRSPSICLTVDATVQERFARKNEAAELHRAFNTLDRNHDGLIDANELNALFLDMGHKAKKVELFQLYCPHKGS